MIGKIIHLPRLFVEMRRQGKKFVDIIQSLDLDIVVFNTLAAPWYFYPTFRWLKSGKNTPRAVAIIHNAHFWCLEYFLDQLSLSDLKHGKFGYVFFNLLYRGVLKGVIKLGDYVQLPKALIDIPVFTIPSRLSEREGDIDRKAEPVTFVIPGKVTQKRRDYISVLKAFRTVFENNPSFKKKVNIVLLGRLEDQKVKNVIERYELQDCLQYYDEFISEEEFKQQLYNAHYAIIPPFISSAYGKYKISGSLNDAISAGLPIILPKTYAPHYRFGKNVLRFSPDNLPSILEKAIDMVIHNKREYRIMKNEARNKRDLWSAEKIATNFEHFLDKVMGEK